LFGALSANRVIRTEMRAKSLKMRAFLKLIETASPQSTLLPILV